jgi:hypothetical protein
LELYPALVLRIEPTLRLSRPKASIRAKVKYARISAADIANAKEAAAEAGLCLKALEKRPDGTVKLEFAEPGMPDDWRVGTVYEQRQ